MKIYILATHQRLSNLEKTQSFWESQGWQTQVEFNDNQHPSNGRNRIIEQFYNSGEPWLAMCDDDTILDIAKGQGKYFAKNAETILDQIPQHYSLIAPMNPLVLMVSATHKDPIYQTHWRLERENSITGKLIFHRNTGNRFYQRTDLSAWEDSEWGYQQIVRGYVPARLNNIVLKETGKSSLFNDKEHRNQAYKESKQKLLDIYPELYINDRNQFVRKDLVKKYISQYPRFYDWALPKL